MSVSDVPENESVVMCWFSVPNVYLIGSHSGCSCGFPSVAAEEAIDYFEGIFSSTDVENRQKDIQSAEALVNLLQQQALPGATLYLYPVWNGDEQKPPKGTISWHLQQLDAKIMVLTERFMHEVVA